MGVVYIPPEGSRCASNDMLDTIGEDLIGINGNNLPVCNMGDFNAKTKWFQGMLSDFKVCDTTVMNSVNIDEVTNLKECFEVEAITESEYHDWKVLQGQEIK